MNRLFRVFAAALFAVALGACGGGDGDGGADDAAADLPPNYVLAKGNKFIPGTLKVKVGDEVTFDFADGTTAHNAVASDKSFDTGVHTEKTVPVKITKAGEHKYICTLHPTMKGTIIAE